MEFLRSSGLNEITVSIPTSYPNEDFSCLFTDSMAVTSFTLTGQSGASGILELTLPSYYKKYDAEFEVMLTNEDDEELVSYEVTVVRPYCDPASAAAKLGISLQNATEYEKVARYIIDSKTGGFRRYRKVVGAVGEGLDYLPMYERITKLYGLKENGETQDVSYFAISLDKTSIVAVEDERLEYRPVWNHRYMSINFPDGFDYEIDGDFGYQVIPGNIQEATLLLIQDISCGNNKYINKYIQEYNTDGYDLKYFDYVYHTTGNLIVDKILSKYADQIKARLL